MAETKVVVEGDQVEFNELSEFVGRQGVVSVIYPEMEFGIGVNTNIGTIYVSAEMLVVLNA